MAQWFILHGEEVRGPMSAGQVKTWAEQHPNQSRVLVWGKPQNEWKSIQWWLVEHPSLEAKIQEIHDDRQWHYAANGKSHGPFKRSDLITQLREIPMSQDLLLWTKGMPAWAPLFEFHDILNEIGVNRRQFPRADIEGKVVFQHNGQNVTGNLLTISEGGMGFDGVIGLTPGLTLTADLDSDSFYDPIHVKIEIRYVTDHGFVGTRFLALSSESRIAIIQYVKQTGRTVIRSAAS